VGQLLLGLALLKRFLHLAHHRLLDVCEVDLDGWIGDLCPGLGCWSLLGRRPLDCRARRGGNAAFQSIDQAVERRVRQQKLPSLIKPLRAIDRLM